MMLYVSLMFYQHSVSFQTSHRMFFFSLSLSFSCLPRDPLSFQKSVIQQLDSFRWRKFVCAGRSPHSPTGPQLHQSHHRGSLQRPQGLTHPVSTPSATPQVTRDGLLITFLLLLKSNYHDLRGMKAQILDIHTVVSLLTGTKDTFDLNLHPCLFLINIHKVC